MNTAEDLKKELGRFPRLDDVAKQFLDMEGQIAARRAAAGELPFPVFKLGSNKSPWLVDIKYFAEYIERQSIEAKQSHRTK